MLSILPLTELIIGLPLYRRMPRSIAVVSEVSICSGSAITLCRRVTTRSIITGSSISGRPTLTSRICAPLSSCAMPSPRMYSMLFSRRAALNLLLPVGLIRSPMITGFGPISTACENEETTVRRLATGGRNGTLLHFSMVSRRCSGVVPQQPPSACTPMPAISSIRSENSAGAISNTVLPFSLRGRPAFGLTMIGSELTCVSRSMIGCICFGPRPQLTPSASTRKPSSMATVESTVPPVSSLPFSSKISVTSTGRSQFSLAANTAALAS